MSNIENESPLSSEQPSSASVTPPADTVNQNPPEQANADDSSLGFNSLADALVGNMPDVSEHVVNAHEQEQSAQAHENALMKDKRGDTFDPDTHATNDDGSPKMTAAGYFAKKRGRKAGSTKSTLNTGSAQKHQETIDPQKAVKAQQRMAGNAAANTLITLGVVMGGEEWQPMKSEEHGIDEKMTLEMAFSDYFEAKNMDDIPAGVALSIAVMGYALPRFTMPKTQQRSKTMWGKVKKWWINRKLKKHNLKAEEIKKEKENDSTDNKKD